MLAPSILDRKSTRLNSSHTVISYAVFCLKKKRSCAHACSLQDTDGYRDHALNVAIAGHDQRADLVDTPVSDFSGFRGPFFFNDTATTEIYTLSLHRRSSDLRRGGIRSGGGEGARARLRRGDDAGERTRSEEHTSELQSHSELVCRLLLEK